jgi:hypothetical protein
VPLTVVCSRDDAQKKKNGFSPINRDIIRIVLGEPVYWDMINQIIRTCKPIVDAIGNLESRDANLADCMLELLRCARVMIRLELDDRDDPGFWAHAKAVFLHEFHLMDTNVHSLALFLHPKCRRLAVSQVAKGRSFQSMCSVALEIANRWGWSEAEVIQMIDDLKRYHQGRSPFTGGSADAKEWWSNLAVAGNKSPLKRFAIVIFSIVPHAAEVERLFSSLGGIQGVKRSRLTVPHFEALGKLRSSYAQEIYKKAKAEGKPICRKHVHMHTRSTPGINGDLAEELEANFTSTTTPVLEIDDALLGPETITPEEIEAEFAAFAEEISHVDLLATCPPKPDEVYDFDELEKVDRGGEVGDLDDADRSHLGSEAGGAWSVEGILSLTGVTLN